MGKECLWGGGKSSKRVGKGGGARENDNARTSGCMCSMFQLFDFHQFPFVLHQQLPSSEPRNSFLLEPAPISKGVEAPRNSLELEKPSLPVSIQDVDLSVPIGIQVKTKGEARSEVQRAAKDSSSSSDVSSSPATKTPTLVARLMGLDLLPDQSSLPRHSSSSTHGMSHLERKPRIQPPFRSRYPLHCKSASFDSECRGTWSLPGTPRISSARRSDVEHRLSLLINKENMTPVSEEMVLSRFSSLKRNEHKTEKDSRTPGHQVTQIAKQVKDSVSRKVGLDITNTVRSREQETRREHELVTHLKSKKFSKALTRVNVDVSSSGKHSTSSCSQRQKSLDQKNKPITRTVDTAMLSKYRHIPQTPKQPILSSSQVNILSSQNTKASYTKSNSRAVKEYHHRHHHKQIKLRKNVTEERFGPPSRNKKLPQTTEVVRNKQAELFVRSTTATRANIPDKKSKKTPLSNEFLHNITVSALLPVKKVNPPPKQVLPIAQESKYSSQLSSCSSQSYETKTLNSRDSYNDGNNEDRTNGATTCTTTGGGTAKEYEHITKILRSTGIDKHSPMSCTRCFSSHHPLDHPSIYYLLEHFTTNEKCRFGQLARCCNRKLLFRLVDQVLTDVLRPFISRKPWAGSSIIRQDFIRGHMEGSQLVDMLCSRVRNFACSHCQVLEDIDALIDKDLTQLWLQGEVALDEDGEGIATEIEKDIIDKLIQETAVALHNGGRN